MQYKNIVQGKFLSRPNRFIAKVEIGGEIHTVHVKNTGRCKELLTEGATVFLEESDNPNRKTKFDLISVYKGDQLINMDSQVPNKMVGEWLEKSGLFPNLTYTKAECTYKSSRFDIYLEFDGKKAFIEVKGVTLEEENVAFFPDAPTERGIKHLNELSACLSDGYLAYVIFVVQMENCHTFYPNEKTHPEFATALRNAKEKGVNVIAVNSKVEKDSIYINDFITAVV